MTLASKHRFPFARVRQVRQEAQAFEWLVQNNAELRRAARHGKQVGSTIHGWEVVKPDGRRYFSVDALMAVQYARTNTEDLFRADYEPVDVTTNVGILPNDYARSQRRYMQCDNCGQSAPCGNEGHEPWTGERCVADFECPGKYVVAWR